MARENKKDVILQTAIELFYTKGFTATSTSEIAARAGVAEGTIFRHFKTKKEILLAVLENFIEVYGHTFAVQPIQDIVSQSKDKDIKEVLKLIMKDRLTLIEQNAELIWIVVTEMRYQPEIKEKVIDHIGQKLFMIMREFFAYGVENGIFREGDPTAMLRGFIGSALGLVIQHKAFAPGGTTTKSLDQSMDEAIDLFLNGVCVQ